jgi:hypothetical protein
LSAVVVVVVVVVAIEALGILVFAQQPTFQKEAFSRIQNASK